MRNVSSGIRSAGGDSKRGFIGMMVEKIMAAIGGSRM